MSSSISNILTGSSTKQTVLFDDEGNTITEAEAAVDDAQDQAQIDATNAARVAEAAKKKKTTSTVLTSPLGTSKTAATSVTRLGGM